MTTGSRAAPVPPSINLAPHHIRGRACDGRHFVLVRGHGLAWQDLTRIHALGERLAFRALAAEWLELNGLAARTGPVVGA